MGIEKLTVLKKIGPLNKVWLMWGVVKKFHDLSTEAHSAEIAVLEKQIDQQFEDSSFSEESEERRFRAAASLSDQRQLADLSGNILVRAAIFHLLTAFVQFAVKEIFKLVFPNRAIPNDPDFMRDFINPLRSAGAFVEFPTDYTDNVFKYREAVRNQFAHGDWVELANEIRGLDLGKAFEGTAKLMEHFQTNLQRIRPHEYYKVMIVGKWQGEKDERLVKVWKFLVQVPESLNQVTTGQLQRRRERLANRN